MPALFTLHVVKRTTILARTSLRRSVPISLPLHVRRASRMGCRRSAMRHPIKQGEGAQVHSMLLWHMHQAPYECLHPREGS